MGIPRTIRATVLQVLRDFGKMAFVSGPRQVGKTTLAMDVRNDFTQGLSFNWDVITDQKRLLANPYFFEGEQRDPRKPFLVIFDEIHKYARWKNYLKGAYDRHRGEFRFLVTGSGRLDLFKKGGDSLMGRYLGIPLFPLSVGELSGNFPSWEQFRRSLTDPPEATPAATDAYRRLWQFSGFPEPFVRGSKTFYNMWFQERKSLLIRQDIRDAANIREISLLEMLSHMIPDRVGSPLSLNSLREDVGVAFETVRDWMLLLERFYYLVRIPPFTGSISRSLKKESKVYLYDWVEVAEESARFENMTALHLVKAVGTWRATGGGDIRLYYVRDKEKREVDFLIVEGRRPICLIECKLSDQSISPSLVRFQERLRVPTAIQIVRAGGVCRKTGSREATRWILSADRFLNLLP